MVKMKEMLDEFEDKKIILTNANEKEKIKLGLVNLPYEIFSLSHNPNKTNQKYYEKMLKYFSLTPEEVIYFEHNEDAIKSAKSIGINTFHYNKDNRDLVSLKSFLNQFTKQFIK